ncbi:MAG TPA: phenylalanine--tRNA ligase subunit alpha, partial [Blastocatellia bacterium]|nr:phenylalanine--tRNA ligase subunit alpha [Blastocatellia bacterium]
MNTVTIFSEDEFAVLNHLRQAGTLEVNELAKQTGLDQSKVMAVATVMAERGFVEISEREREEIIPDEGAAKLLDAGLPESRAARMLVDAGGELPMESVVSWASENGIAIHEVMRWGQARGWLQKKKAANWTPENKQFAVALTAAGTGSVGKPQDDEKAVKQALSGRVFVDELGAHGLDEGKVAALLANRASLARIKRRSARTLELSPAGAAALEAAGDARVERNLLTSEDLRSGAWREISLRPYDVSLPARKIFPAKTHPLRKIIDETRRAFLEMGFTEVVSPMVESAFWNFDALYQPQDHPARDMQDTFYMADPARLPLPDAETVDRVRLTHQDGWETGSQGWGYTWDPEQARRVVMRTHTTAATIRALARHPKPPLKVFCVGWTYRNESISYKHLPVFHQVDGVVIDEEANLATLLGTLREFYRKMGFDKVKFKPA